MPSFTTSIEFDDQDIVVEVEYAFHKAIPSDGVSPFEAPYFEIADLIDVNVIGFDYDAALEANLIPLLMECQEHHQNEQDQAAEYAAEAKRERMIYD